jgi:hypothetical protein
MHDAINDIGGLEWVVAFEVSTQPP